MIMGMSFIFQTAINHFAGSEVDEDTGTAKTAHPAHQSFSYEDAVRKQEAEGGPQRYYDQGEGLDDASALVTEE